MHISSNSLVACLGRFEILPVGLCPRSTVVEGIYKEQTGDAVHEENFSRKPLEFCKAQQVYATGFWVVKKGIFCETTGSLEGMWSEMILWDRRVIGMGRTHY